MAFLENVKYVIFIFAEDLEGSIIIVIFEQVQTDKEQMLSKLFPRPRR